MKLFAPALIFCGAAAFAQSPQVPHKMQFAGMSLTIRDDARREIQKDVDALTKSPKYFKVKTERAKIYFPTIEKVFAEERLPDDFKYLSLQESALIADAVSTSDAVGFWQFKDFTAQEVGLRVDSEVDERMNIESASRGAAKYLKQCNHYFNNWVYALQAYQMGAGGVMRMVGDKDLGGRRMDITSDTYWYVKKFLAHKVAFENSVQGKPEIEVSGIQVTGMSLREVSREVSVDEEKLREFNKWLKSDQIPKDKTYLVMVPKGNVEANFSVLAVASATQPAASKAVAGERILINGVPALRAVKGETLAAMAGRGGVGIAAFMRYNEIEIDHHLKAGNFYFLEKKKKQASQELYTLLPGDDLWSVSQRFGVRQKSLAKFNRLEKDARVVSGTTLYLANRRPASQKPEAGEPAIDVVVLDEEDTFDWSEPSASIRTVETLPVIVNVQEPADEQSISLLDEKGNKPAASFHEVKASDTIYSVARQYGVTIQELMEWNEKKDFNLSIGERLKVNPH